MRPSFRLLALVFLAALPIASPQAPAAPLAPQSPAVADPSAATYEAPFVTSDTATLRASLVLPVDAYIFRSSEMGRGMPFFNAGQPRGAIAEYREMLELLRAADVHLIDVRDALQEAIEEARRRGELGDRLAEIFPVHADDIRGRLGEIDAASLLFLRPDHVYMERGDGTVAPLFPGFSSMYWARDWAATTPAGVVIGNSRRFTRSLENRLARFLFSYAPSLRDFPVVFDAGEEGVHLDGGDLIVFDERTLLLGVDNRTSREAAPLLARRLDMDVLAVSLPSWEERSGLNRQLLHLDTTFNLVDTDTVVATPYFLEARFADDNPIAPLLQGLAAQTDRWNEAVEAAELNEESAEYVRTTVQQMPPVGRMTRYAAGSGAEEPLDVELVDWARQRGYGVIYVGGDRQDMPELQWAVERAMYELRWQGANVVQLGPGRVVAFEHNEATNAALRQAGIEVFGFPGELIALRGGGPHCLLMPLVRK